MQRAVGVVFAHRHVGEDGFKQRIQRALAHRGIVAGVTVEGRGVDHREVQLRFGGAEFVEQIESLVDHPVGACAGTVNLVDHHDGFQAEGQRLAGDKARLRHRAFNGIDQQQHTVDHRQHALDLAAEVGVSRGVDDIDQRTVPDHRAVLGKNGDAALAFEVVGVHHAFSDLLVRGEGAGLP